MNPADLFQSYIGPADPNLEQLRRLFLRSTPSNKAAPSAPRGLHIDKTNRNALVWESPANMFGVTHYNIYVDSQTPQSLFRQIPSAQKRMGEPVSGTRFFVTSFNFFNGEESAPAVVDNQVPIALNGIFLVGANATVTIDPQNGEVIVEDATVKTTIDDHQPTGGGAAVGGIGVLSKANLSQTTMASGFFVAINKNGKPTVSIATINEALAGSAGILRVFDGTGTGNLGSGQALFYDASLLLGEVRGTWKVQIAAGTTYAQLAEVGQVSGVDSAGAWGLSSASGLTIKGSTVIDSNLNATFHQLSIGTFGLVIAPAGDANFNTVSVNALLVIKTDGTVNGQGSGIQVNGTTRIDSSGNVHSANGANGTCPLAKLTAGGSNGSFTVVDGQVTAFVAPT